MKQLLYFISLGYSTIIFSQCIVGNCENGEGTYIYKDKTKVTGQWKDRKANGTCQIFYADGAVYNGEMKDNAISGLGKLITKENVVFEGSFIKGNLNGKGKTTYPDGYELEGNFVNDTLTGMGSIKNKDGFTNLVLSKNAYQYILRQEIPIFKTIDQTRFLRSLTPYFPGKVTT